MPWPLSQDYNEAIQSPASCFADAELRLAEAKCNAIGLPMPRSGNFADVYEMSGPGGKKWAVKCFTRHVSGLRERYAAISAYLKQANLPFMVDFSYLEQGIQVKGQWYPILKMDWVEGFTLNEFIGQNADNPGLLQATADIWLKVARRLREARMAHCDLQHGNVLLVPGKRDGALSVRLIDYDGMFVPALANTRSGEVGHAAFQHPQRLREAIYNGEVDRFPHLVIYTALRGLIVCGSSLWKRYDNGDNLLFRQQDLAAPGQSPLVRELIRVEDAELRRLLDQLSRSVHKPLEQTPLLDELVTAPGKRRLGGRSKSGSRRGSRWPVLGGVALLLMLLGLAGVGVYLGSNHNNEPLKHAATTAPNRPPSNKSPVSTGRIEPSEDNTSTNPSPVVTNPPPPTNTQRNPVPDAAAQARAEKAVRQQFAADYANQDPASRRALAEKLLQQALAAQEAPAQRFVLLREARDLAAAAGELAIAFQAIDALAKDFAVSTPELRTAALESARGALLTPVTSAGFARTAAAVLEAALAEDHFDVAPRLLALGQAAALKARHLRLLAAVQVRADELPEIRHAFDLSRSDALALARKPDHPDANLKLGRYLCLYKGHWEAGLPLLIRGSNAKLRELAQRDQAAPKEAAEQAALGDAWWSAAEKETGLCKTQAQRRAAWWYRLASAGLAGTARTNVQQRIDQVLVPPMQIPDPEPARERQRLEGHKGAITCVALSRDGRRALSAGGDMVVRLWDLETAKEVRRLEGHKHAEMLCLVFSRDGRQAVSGCRDGTLRRWDLDTGKELQIVSSPQSQFGSVAVSRDFRRALVDNADGTVTLWDLEASKEERRLEGQNSFACLAFLPDGQRAISGGTDGAVQLWDLETGQMIRLLAAPAAKADSVRSIAIRADGRQALVAGDDRGVRVWDLVAGTELRSLAGHTGSVTSVAFSPDGRRAVSGGADRTVRVWDLETGKEIRRLEGHTMPVRGLVYSPDGCGALSGGEDGILRVWGPGLRPTDVPTLARMLKDPDATIRYLTVELLKDLGPAARPAAPAVAAILTDPDANVRRLAPFALVAITPAAAAAVPLLVEAIQGQDKAHRALAFEALGKLGPEARASVPALLQALKSSEGPVRASAAGVLGRIGPDARPALSALLAAAQKDSDAQVRLAALQALPRLGSGVTFTAPELAALLKDPDRDVQLAVVQVLRQMASESSAARRFLITAVRDNRLKKSAGEALVQLGKPAVPDLLEALQGATHHSHRADMIELLGAIGPGAAAAAVPLTEMLRNKNMKALRLSLVRALGRIGPSAAAAVPALYVIADEDLNAERDTALVGIGKGAVPYLVEVVKNTDNESERVRVIRLLARMGPNAREAIPVLTHVVNTSRVRLVTTTASEALGAIQRKQ